MDTKLIAQMKSAQETQSTAELRKIWMRHDTEEWRDEAFAAIREILEERGLELVENPRDVRFTDDAYRIVLEGALQEQWQLVQDNIRKPHCENFTIHLKVIPPTKEENEGRIQQSDVIFDGHKIGEMGAGGGMFDIHDYNAGIHTLFLVGGNHISNVLLFETNGDLPHAHVECEFELCLYEPESGLKDIAASAAVTLLAGGVIDSEHLVAQPGRLATQERSRNKGLVGEFLNADNIRSSFSDAFPDGENFSFELIPGLSHTQESGYPWANNLSDDDVVKQVREQTETPDVAMASDYNVELVEEEDDRKRILQVSLKGIRETR